MEEQEEEEGGGAGGGGGRRMRRRTKIRSRSRRKRRRRTFHSKLGDLMMDAISQIKIPQRVLDLFTHRTFGGGGFSPVPPSASLTEC